MKLPIRKALGALAAATLLTVAANAQVLINENFGTTATGTTAPSGWTIDNLLGAESNATAWNIEVNPAVGIDGNMTISAPAFTGAFAIFDSDGESDDTTAEDTVLVSPAFDASGGTISLSFDHAFLSGFGGAWAVEVFNGTTWTQVAGGTTPTQGAGSGTTCTASAAVSNLDITAATGNNAAAQVRFRWTGDFSWWWIVDNVNVTKIVAGTPLVSINNASVTEGNSGTTNAVVTVSTDIPAVDTINMTYTTANGSATTAGGDYVGATAVPISIAAGDSSTSFTLTVNGDTNLEPNETFNVNLALVSGTATVVDGTGTVTINNDDLFGGVAGATFGINTFPAAGRGFYRTNTSSFLASIAVAVDTVSVPNTAAGGDFNGADETTFYSLRFAATNNFVRVNTSTGAVVVSSTTGLTGRNPVDLMWNPADGEMYGISLETTAFTGFGLHVVDESTGAFGTILPITGTTALAAAGFGPDGTLYAVDATTDTFGTINTTTGAYTSIGSLGIITDVFFQDMDFDYATGTLWWTTVTDVAFESNLYTLNTTTGAATLVGAADGLTTAGVGQGAALGIVGVPVSTVSDWTTIE